MQDDSEKVKAYTVILEVVCWEFELKALRQEAFCLQQDQYLSLAFKQNHKSHTSKKRS